MEEEGEAKHISQNEINQSNDEIEKEELSLIKFLDSLDNYLIFMNNLSSALRQSWLDLSSARHSMGALRISSAMFDHKNHDAATSVQVDQADGSSVEPPHFKLCKWVSSNHESNGSRESETKENEFLRSKSGSAQLRHRSMPQNSDSGDIRPENRRSSTVVDDQVQKERLKSLSMFGTLVSPKLRSAQLSFETALAILVEAANMRASLLSAYDEVSKGMNDAK
ncbi:hypothetical protein LIER_26616 [Lithospermum erythrorhizon]|uniref:Vacuolar ATPase assembly protein VMA22 n=1 Tax=Lithospermum erythrorhizon TaxID=34254 RepID=A0AAV3R909_LITER